MPILPLDHPEPFAATLGVMLSPGEDEASRKWARSFASQYLAEPLRRFHEAGHRLSYEDLARIVEDAGTPLDDLQDRWWGGMTAGEVFRDLFGLNNTNRSLASWGNATKLVEAQAGRHGLPGSRTSIYEARRRFSSVSHLWAAWQFRQGRFESQPDVGYDGAHDFDFFLAEAEILRRWGQSWRPNHTSAESMMPTHTWRVPEGWAPPEHQTGWPPTGRIPVITFSDAVLADLRGPGRPRKPR